MQSHFPLILKEKVQPPLLPTQREDTSLQQVHTIDKEAARLPLGKGKVLLYPRDLSKGSISKHFLVYFHCVIPQG